MTSESNPAGESGEASVVLASFDSYRRAEHMLASLGGGFRRMARKGGAHVGSEERRVHEILAGAGPHAALVLVRCKDPQTRQLVAAAAADTASDSWAGSLTEFLAALDPGSDHDWVRAAVGERSGTNR